MFAVGEVCEQLIRDGAIVQGAPDDKIMKHALSDQARIVTEKVIIAFSFAQVWF